MLDLNHGGHVLPQDAPGAKDLAKKFGFRLAKKPPPGTPFDYLLPDLKKKPEAHIPGDPATVAAALKAILRHPGPHRREHGRKAICVPPASLERTRQGRAGG